MYSTENFKTKAALKRAVTAHKSGEGPAVTIFAPGLGQPKTDGVEFLEGPHYPAPHSWYAQVTMTNGVVTAVK